MARFAVVEGGLHPRQGEPRGRGQERLEVAAALLRQLGQRRLDRRLLNAVYVKLKELSRCNLRQTVRAGGLPNRLRHR